jgi:outer membrane lipoprotein-sorting protein
MLNRWMTIAILFAAAMGMAFAQKPDPAQRVRAAYQAESRVSLSGVMRTTSTVQATEISSEVVVYRKAGMTRYEYRSPELRGLVLIDKGDTLIRLDPATRTATVETVHRSPATVDLVLKNYRAELSGQERLLGRQTDVITLKPQQRSGPTRKLWIDRATGVVLRTEQYNSSGKLVSRSFYSSVDWKASPPDSLFTVPEGWRQVVAPVQTERHWEKEDLSRRLGFTIREPGYVPPGFVLDGFHLVVRPNAQPSAHIRYVDGLNSISIFEHGCPPGRGRGFQWGRRMGRRGNCEFFTSNEGNVLVKEVGGIRFIVVGDLPENELQKVIDTLR